jgi:hypothetical protein
MVLFCATASLTSLSIACLSPLTVAAERDADTDGSLVVPFGDAASALPPDGEEAGSLGDHHPILTSPLDS